MLYELGAQTPRIQANVFIAPNATIIGDVELQTDSSIWFGAVLRGDIERIKIGRGSNIQDGTICHTDPTNPCIVGEYVTVGHLAMLHGCNVGDGSLVGLGATLMNGSVIGRNCIVGAHALITEGKLFPDGVVITGAPAKIVREVDANDLARLRANAERYIERAQRYLKELRPIEPPR